MGVQYYKPRSNWVYQWTRNGVRKKRYFKTQQEALDFEREILARECEQFRDFSLGELVALYFRSNPDKHYKTKKNIVYFLAGHEKNGRHIEGAGEFLRDKIAERLTRVDLEAMREALRARGASNATQNRYQAYIRAILAWGADQELISRNPWREYKRLKTQRRIITATLADFQRIIACCPDWLKWALATAYALALRPGLVELFGLTWISFNWKLGFVQFYQGKTGRLKRVFPPIEYMLEAKARHEQDSYAGIPWVCHRDGRKVLDYKDAWKKAVVDAGLKGSGIRMYDIRHVAASEMLAAGADLAAVAAQLGHASIQTTATTYAHVTPGGQARAAALMPALEPKKNTP